MSHVFVEDILSSALHHHASTNCVGRVPECRADYCGGLGQEEFCEDVIWDIVLACVEYAEVEGAVEDKSWHCEDHTAVEAEKAVGFSYFGNAVAHVDEFALFFGFADVCGKSCADEVEGVGYGHGDAPGYAT